MGRLVTAGDLDRWAAGHLKGCAMSYSGSGHHHKSAWLAKLGVKSLPTPPADPEYSSRGGGGGGEAGGDDPASMKMGDPASAQFGEGGGSGRPLEMEQTERTAPGGGSRGIEGAARDGAQGMGDTWDQKADPAIDKAQQAIDDLRKAHHDISKSIINVGVDGARATVEGAREIEAAVDNAVYGDGTAEDVLNTVADVGVRVEQRIEGDIATARDNAIEEGKQVFNEAVDAGRAGVDAAEGMWNSWVKARDGVYDAAREEVEKAVEDGGVQNEMGGDPGGGDDGGGGGGDEGGGDDGGGGGGNEGGGDDGGGGGGDPGGGDDGGGGGDAGGGGDDGGGGGAEEPPPSE